MQDLRQSSNWAKYLEFIGWKVEKINNVYVYLKKIPVLGYFIKIQRPGKILKKDIEKLKQKFKPFQICIEPDSSNQVKLLKELNFKLSKSPSLPTKTLQIDLSRSEETLLKKFSQKTRYNIKLSQRKEIDIKNYRDVLLFTKFWRENFEKNRFPFLSQQKNIIALYNAFGKDANILLVKRNEKIIAGLFILIYDKVAYYMYAASNDYGRKNFAPTLLTWNAILMAKKNGCKIFDFDGIYDERFPIKTWLGFTKFKKGFGGKEVLYPGNFVKNKFYFKI